MSPDLHGKRWGLPLTLRFDPMESEVATPFSIDWMGLYAENENNTFNKFNIQWTVDDPEDDTMSISLYYDTDTSGYNGTLITTLNGQTDGDGSHNWNTNGVNPGNLLYLRCH